MKKMWNLIFLLAQNWLGFVGKLQMNENCATRRPNYDLNPAESFLKNYLAENFSEVTSSIEIVTFFKRARLFKQF